MRILFIIIGIFVAIVFCVNLGLNILYGNYAPQGVKDFFDYGLTERPRKEKVGRSELSKKEKAEASSKKKVVLGKPFYDNIGTPSVHCQYGLPKDNGGYTFAENGGQGVPKGSGIPKEKGR